jgi:hypothetical protein
MEMGTPASPTDDTPTTVFVRVNMSFYAAGGRMISSRRPDAIQRAAVVFETPQTSAAPLTERPGIAIVAGAFRGSA